MASAGPLRVLQVVTDNDRRGAQKFALDLGEALKTFGHHVETDALAPGVNTDGFPVSTLGPRRRSLKTLRSLRRRMCRFDLTIAHGSTTGPLCALASVTGGGPFVYRQISDQRFWARTRAQRARVKWFAKRARLVVALSQRSHDDLVEYIGISTEHVRVIPNGVPSRGFAPTTTEERGAARAKLGLMSAPTIAYIGALVPEKGVDLAVAALESMPRAQIVILGDGPQRGLLEAQAAQTAPGRVFFFSGSEIAPYDAYRASDVVVLPSRGGDSMPAVLIEAGFCALPTVTTSVGGIDEIVRDGETGSIVPVDDVQAIVTAVAGFLHDPVKASLFGDAARSRCLSLFDINSVTRAWEHVLYETARTPGFDVCSPSEDVSSLSE